MRQDDNAARAKEGKRQVAVTGKEGQVPANREKALFSHIWNYARNAGMTKLPNPCAGIKGFKEQGRDVYVDDELYAAVWGCPEQGLPAMDLAYLSAQRKADVLKISRPDLSNDELTVAQNKTGKRLRISVEGQLADVITRIKRRKVAGVALVCNSAGQRMSEYELRGAFDRARDAAAAQDQLGHTTPMMTSHYVRNRRGKLVKPTK